MVVELPEVDDVEAVQRILDGVAALKASPIKAKVPEYESEGQALTEASQTSDP
jgi:hypothetical protein